VNNLFVHPKTGDIWFGASPVVYKLLDYFKSPSKNVAPSQVVQIMLLRFMPWNFVLAAMTHVQYIFEASLT